MTDAAPERGQPPGGSRSPESSFAERVAAERTTRTTARSDIADASVAEPDTRSAMGATAVTLVATATFGVTTVLALLVVALAPTVVLGWDATVIESSSMQPTVVRGDIVVLRPLEGWADVGAVVRFPADDGGTSIVHRVVDVDLEAKAYVTKGDANRSDDQAMVPFADVDGLGTLLVPLIGHPSLWFREGHYLALAITALAGAGAIWGGLNTDRRRDSIAADTGGSRAPTPIVGDRPLGPWSIHISPEPRVALSVASRLGLGRAPDHTRSGSP